MATALLFTGQLHCLEGAYARAEEMLTEGIEVARAVGDVVVLSMQLAYLGHALVRVGWLDEATSHLDEAVRIARERRLDTALAWALGHGSGSWATVAPVGV